MIKSKLGTNGNKLVGPPSDTDGMLGIVRGKAGPAPDLVVKIFVTHGEERISRESETLCNSRPPTPAHNHSEPETSRFETVPPSVG